MQATKEEQEFERNVNSLLSNPDLRLKIASDNVTLVLQDLVTVAQLTQEQYLDYERDKLATLNCTKLNLAAMTALCMLLARKIAAAETEEVAKFEAQTQLDLPFEK